MGVLNKFKFCAVISLVAGISTTQVSAQVSTNRLTCLDETNGISFNVHFQGKQVILHMKGYTYHLLYYSAFVSKKGERWSVYRNPEIEVFTTIPYDRYVAINTPSGVPIAGSFTCN